MREVKYSQDGDALLVELSDQPIDDAVQCGQVIVHFSPDDTLVLLEILDASNFVRDALRAMIQAELSSPTPTLSAGLARDVMETLLNHLKSAADQAQKRAS